MMRVEEHARTQVGSADFKSKSLPEELGEFEEVVLESSELAQTEEVKSCEARKASKPEQKVWTKKPEDQDAAGETMQSLEERMLGLEGSDPSFAAMEEADIEADECKEARLKEARLDDLTNLAGMLAEGFCWTRPLKKEEELGERMAQVAGQIELASLAPRQNDARELGALNLGQVVAPNQSQAVAREPEATVTIETLRELSLAELRKFTKESQLKLTVESDELTNLEAQSMLEQAPHKVVVLNQKQGTNAEDADTEGSQWLFDRAFELKEVAAKDAVELELEPGVDLELARGEQKPDGLLMQSEFGSTGIEGARFLVKGPVVVEDRLIFRQVAQQVELAMSQGVSSGPVKIQMGLEPKELGALMIELVVDGSQITAVKISAENPQTRDLLASNMAALKQELSRNHSEVIGVEISGEITSSSQDATSSGQQENLQRQRDQLREALQEEPNQELFALKA